MKWTRLTIKTSVEAEDIIISEMYELGLQGAQIEDHVPLSAWEKEQMFVDILPETEPDDGRALLHFFVEVAGENDATPKEQGFTVNGISDAEDNSYSYVSGENVVSDLEGLKAAMEEKLAWIASFMDIGEGVIEVGETEDKDWANSWKEFFKPFDIDDLRIVPTWCEEEPAKGHTVLRLDPGSAFGTGMHETTQLCIREIKAAVKGSEKILDVGTGSGILGIAALLFGAGSVTGTDLDLCARGAVWDNLAHNHITEDRFRLIIGNVINDEEIRSEVRKQAREGYDIVVANILAEVLVSLTPVAAGFVKEGGLYITSGILEGKEDMVADACKKAGLSVLAVRTLGEWKCVVARREL